MTQRHRTREQSNTKEWHYARVRRITSSICGQILTQKSITIALLCHSLYPKPLDPLPDAKVYDPSCIDCNGIAEFKCPYSKRDKSPQESCQDPNFFCELANGSFQLKHKHNYFHQVQLQLFVSGDMFSWCSSRKNLPM